MAFIRHSFVGNVQLNFTMVRQMHEVSTVPLMYQMTSDVLPCSEEMLKDLELEREELEKEKAESRQRQDPH